MKGIVFGLFLLLSCSVSTQAQTTKVPGIYFNLLGRWSHWELDSTRNDAGRKEVYWSRYKYKRNTAMRMVTEKMILTYNESDRLTRKIKKRGWHGCFVGTDKILYDKRF